MEELTSTVAASTEYVGRWNRLISTTNWEKGRIILQWREAMQQAGSPPEEHTDEVWSRQVGAVTPQHVGRLRRVFERFGDSHEQYRGLYWSHFLAAIDWTDAEMYLEGAVQNDWSVSMMRVQRWEAMGGRPDQKPQDADIVSNDLDEDVLDSQSDAAQPSMTITNTFDDVHGADSSSYDESESAPFGEGDYGPLDSAPMPDDSPAMAGPKIRPFESLPPLPSDLNEGFELMKLAILNHKVSGWRDIARDDVLSVLESLRQLVLAPAE